MWTKEFNYILIRMHLIKKKRQIKKYRDIKSQNGKQHVKVGLFNNRQIKDSFFMNPKAFYYCTEQKYPHFN